MKSRLKLLLYRMGITTRTDYELVLGMVSRQGAMLRDLERRLEFRTIQENAKSAEFRIRLDHFLDDLRKLNITMAIKSLTEKKNEQ